MQIIHSKGVSGCKEQSWCHGFYVQDTGRDAGTCRGYWPGERQVWMVTPWEISAQGLHPWLAVGDRCSLQGSHLSQRRNSGIPGSQGSSPRLWKHLNDPGRLCFLISCLTIKLGCFSVICVPASSCHLPLLTH